VQRVSLFTPEFDAKLNALKSDDARASEMEHAIKNEIHVKLDEDPAYYLSLRQRLEEIIEDRKARRIDAAKQLELLQILVKDIKGPTEQAGKLGLSPTGFAIYGLLLADRPATPGTDAKANHDAKPEPATVALSTLLEEAVAPHVGIVDWVKPRGRSKGHAAAREATASRGPRARGQARCPGRASCRSLEEEARAVMSVLASAGESSKVQFGRTLLEY
jgi:hypothetical protein